MAAKTTPVSRPAHLTVWAVPSQGPPNLNEKSIWKVLTTLGDTCPNNRSLSLSLVLTLVLALALSLPPSLSLPLSLSASLSDTSAPVAGTRSHMNRVWSGPPQSRSDSHLSLSISLYLSLSLFLSLYLSLSLSLSLYLFFKRFDEPRLFFNPKLTGVYHKPSAST